MDVTQILVEPRYGYSQDGTHPTRPRAQEVLREWIDAVNPFLGRSRVVPFLTAVFHIGAGVCSLVYLTVFLTWDSIPSRVFSFAIGGAIGIVYSCAWWHRYCTHRAFTFRSLAWARLFSWTNPLFYRAETFVLPHRVHHGVADQPGDPYAPASGWLACYLSAETQQRLNTNISRDQYVALVGKLAHIGLRINTYDAFRRTGSLEHIGSFLVHAIAAQLMWVLPLALWGGTLWVLSFYSAVFWSMFVLRDFNYRGHSDEDSRRENPHRGLAGGLSINHRFYGYLTGEWHNNHHSCPTSANTGFLPGQVDLPFLFVRLLHTVGIVSSYRDQRQDFLEKYARRP